LEILHSLIEKSALHCIYLNVKRCYSIDFSYSKKSLTLWYVRDEISN